MQHKCNTQEVLPSSSLLLEAAESPRFELEIGTGGPGGVWLGGLRADVQ
jgi:hypothetical protein